MLSLLVAEACALCVAVASASECGDWLILGGARGVENAPVDCFCSCSKISCSSLGRRGGEGPGDQAEKEGRVVLRAREMVEEEGLRAVPSAVVVVLRIILSLAVRVMSLLTV